MATKKAKKETVAARRTRWAAQARAEREARKAEFAKSGNRVPLMRAYRARPSVKRALAARKAKRAERAKAHKAR